jgi:uncharacterized protein YbaP (TraB family)
MNMIRTAITFLCGLLPLAANAIDAPFLWQVQKPGGAPHYLLGSVHLMPQDAADLPAAIDTVYARAQGLVFESDLDALQSGDIQQRLLAAGRAGSGGLSAEVGSALYARLQSRLKSQGLPASFCDALRAWSCGLFMELASFNKAGFVGAAGIDEQLYQRAGRDGKPRRGLEAPEAQLAVFADMPAATAREVLASSIDDDDNGPESPQALYKAWRRNDLSALGTLVDDMRKHYPGFYERLLAARNRAWMQELPAIYSDTHTQLVVVGAAHCVGPDGLIGRLRALGYAVERYDLR